MPARKVNLDRMHEIELEYMFEQDLGKGSVFQETDEELYTLAKQKFVSDLKGTNWMEILLVISILPLSFVLMNSLYSYLRSKRVILSSHKQFIFEFIILIVPTILVFCNPSTSFIYVIIFIHIVIIFIITALSNAQNIQIWNFNSNECSQQKKPYISFYRSVLMIYTVISILAVDFTVFPRRFCKTETYGFSLMDIGVGSFVIALGLISVLKQTKNTNRSYFVAFRSSMPLFVFGILRFALISMTRYHSHVSEYGVHWNFFFTMFVVTFTNFFVNIKSENGINVAIILLVLYQTFLCLYGSEYVLNQPRISGNFISENKEGLLSCIGYFICYNIGRYIGYHVSRSRSRKQTLLKLIIASIVIFLLCLFTHKYVENASRRLTNVAYILYVSGCNILILILFLSASFMLCYPTHSILLQSINNNQLFTFLFGNILTGLINLQFRTLFAVPIVSYTIITLYMFLVCGISYLLHINHIKIKL